MSHLFLTGFMGAGKSSVGRALAERLGRPFVDLDAEIERREGESVSSVFRTRGESGFRDAEHAALAELADRPDSVIATGGGVVLREDNQCLLKELGTVVYLAVTPEEAMARLGDAGDRPLLVGGGLAAARSILSARLLLYSATADHVVDTGGLDVSAVVESVAEVLGTVSRHDAVRVGAPGDPSGYDVLIGPGLLAELAMRVSLVTGARSVALVTDQTVRALLGDRVQSALEEAGLTVRAHTVEAGERSKTWEAAGALLEAFAAEGLDRSSAVVALGGGVVGDLAGFVAATYMRGIALVQAPTTLLAQVDSAIGGKTGVDLVAGKNLAGAFWPPRLVLADTEVLTSVPDAEWTNGMAEVVKTALLAGSEPLAALERRVGALMVRDPHAVEAAVREAASFKARVVSDDLREDGLRECLNFGHTLGHALEMLVGYGDLPHGLAVAEGLRFAALLSETVVQAPAELTARVTALLERIGAGEAVTAERLVPNRGRVAPGAVLAAMKGDKKSRGGSVRFVVLEAPGRWQTLPVADDVLLGALDVWHGRLGEA